MSYRIYDKENNKFRKDILISQEGLLINKNDEKQDSENFVIQKSTGFFDKNNVEIFDGDYLESEDNSGIENPLCFRLMVPTVCLVKGSHFEPMNNTCWPPQCGGYCGGKEDRVKKASIVGNIFEKPKRIKELIEPAKEMEEERLRALAVLKFKLKNVAVEETSKLKQKVDRNIFSLFFGKNTRDLQKKGVKGWLSTNMHNRKHILQYLWAETEYAVNKLDHFYCQEYSKISKIRPFEKYPLDKSNEELIKKYSKEYSQDIKEFNNKADGIYEF